ncbi:ABC transporter ATP-binding protein [Bombilactobacillus bombi]|uniref:ABC transporter ATP-binding protein n=2 Tax=Bombilactobacillus bombi TaxID=1303590 RepID=A0A417Z696_9LACO|nr:ABC transporter ATP-binding protein [Bombilactobacillus bombi]
MMKLLFGITLIVNLLAPLSNIAFAFSIKILIDAGLAQNLERLTAALQLSGVVICGFVIMNYFAKWLTNIYAQNKINYYRTFLINSIFKLNYQEFSSIKSSDYQHILLNETNQIQQDYLQGRFNIYRNIALIIYSLLGMFIGNFILALLVLIATAIPILISSLTAKKGTYHKQQLLKQEKTYSNTIKEIIGGYLTIKNYQAESAIKQRYKQQLDNYSKAQSKLKNIENQTDTISELSGLIVFLVAFGGGMIMTAKGYTTIGSVTAIVQLVNFVVMPINELGILFTRFRGAYDINRELTKLFTHNKAPVNYIQNKNFTNKISLNQISFHYPKNKTLILSNLTVDFNKGKKYAIIGSSGGGKTTIFKLLLKFYTPNKGGILVDDTPLNELPISWWYQQIAVVDQEVFIFNNTLAYNVTIGRHFAQEKIIQALQQAGLANFLKQINYNLNYQCGENGANLSGGQQQRLCLARAFLQAKPIILLDEATSALDYKASDIIENTLLHDTNLTLIAITHQTKISPLYDQILKLENQQLIPVLDTN